MNKPHIVILGAGYGGLMTATRLQKLLGDNEANITLISKYDIHYESTWLHEVAAGTITKERAQYSVTSVLDKNKVKFIQDTVTKIDKDNKRVLLENSELTYDYLVIGLGFESETFGIQGLKEHAQAISNPETALKTNEAIEKQFSSYNNESEESLTIVVGGAGFTGIEFLGELTNKIPSLCKKYSVSKENVKIYCVEAAPTALPGFDTSLVEYATKQLENKGVEFKIGTAIKECTEKGILVSKNEETEFINANVVIWAAGVRGSQVVDNSEFDSVRGKVKVDKFLRAENHSDVFVVGDCSFLINEENNRPFPPTAQIAMQQGESIANNITSIIRGLKELTPFVFNNKGTVCSLGEHDAIGIVFGKTVKGKTASFMKKMVDNRALLLIGGLPLVFKKGKFNLL